MKILRSDVSGRPTQVDLGISLLTGHIVCILPVVLGRSASEVR